MIFSLILPSFIAGLLTFLAPCTLPFIPVYLGFMGGVSIENVASAQARRKIISNGIFFVLGFSAIFIIFGASLGLVGSALISYRIWLERVSGIMVIIFGLLMMRVIHVPIFTPPFDHEALYPVAKTTVRYPAAVRQPAEQGILQRAGFTDKSLRIPLFFKNGTLLNSFSLGASFAFGWTPCIGPVLGSVLLLASNTATVLQGALLLAIFSLGLAIPFLILALGVGQVSFMIKKINPYLDWIAVAGGVFFIGLGLLLFTQKTELLNSFGYRFFYFVPYERLLNYL